MKNFLKSGLFILIIICMDFGFRFLMEPVTYFGHYADCDYRNNLGKYDTVFIGSSWTFMDYDVSEYDKIMKNTYTFNAGSMTQTPVDTYYYLRQIIKEQPIKTVYFSISPTRFSVIKNKHSSPVVNDRLRGWNKIAHMFAASDKDLICYYSGIYRYKNEVKRETVLNNLKIKRRPDYWDGSLRFDEAEHYEKNGYVASSIKMNQHNNEAYIPHEGFYDWDPDKTLEWNEDYFFRILELCEKKQIKLVFLVPPSSVGLLQATNGYDEFHDFMQDIADQHKIQMVDFNYLKESPFSDDRLFQDYNHLNSEGAETLIAILCKVLYNKGKAETAVFCQKLSDRKDLTEVCGGVMAEVIGSGPSYLITAKPSGPRDKNILYRYWIRESGESNWEMVTDFVEDNILCIQPHHTMQYVKVECCPEGTDENAAAYAFKTCSEGNTTNAPALHAAYVKRKQRLYLVAEGVGNRRLRFLKWQSDNSYKLLQEVTEQDFLLMEIPPYGMHRYKVEYLDPVSGEVTDQAEAFINLEDGWV